MIAPFFHAWERRLASVTTDRVVREFDWGLDWIPNGSLKGRPHQGEEAEQVEQWVDDIMRDTGVFFETPGTKDYSYDRATASLSFPSALTTQHPENNTVHARWFPAATEPAIGAPGPRGRAVVLLPQWNADAEGHVGLAKLLARFGVSALRLSLPYHDARMPPELTM